MKKVKPEDKKVRCSVAISPHLLKELDKVVDMLDDISLYQVTRSRYIEDIIKNNLKRIG